MRTSAVAGIEAENLAGEVHSIGRKTANGDSVVALTNGDGNGKNQRLLSLDSPAVQIYLVVSTLEVYVNPGNLAGVGHRRHATGGQNGDSIDREFVVNLPDAVVSPAVGS